MGGMFDRGLKLRREVLGAECRQLPQECERIHDGVSAHND
jgi:hypothetical protein